MDNEEARLLDIQLIATLIFIGSLALSFYLTYSDKIDVLYDDPLIPDENYYKLSVFNRFLVFILSLVFLYTNYKNKQLAKSRNEPIEPFNLQITASNLNILAALIVLYVVITSGNYSIVTSVGNPNL